MMDKYLKEEIQRIEELKSKGHTVRYILDLNEFSLESLRHCGLPVSYLVPTSEHQRLSSEEWNTHTSSEHKWELLEGMPFMSPLERDRVMLGLIYSAGLRHLLEVLPAESKEELKLLLSS